MKKVKAFFAMLYVQLAVQYSIVFVISGESTSEGLFLAMLLLLGAVSGATEILGWIAAVKCITKTLAGATDADEMKKSWFLLKIKTIPFYILNFIYGLAYGILLVGATRGMIWFVILPILIPIWHTCSFIVQSGFYGVANILMLRKEHKKEFSKIHYILQFIPVFDVFDTIAIRGKMKNIEY